MQLPAPAIESQVASLHAPQQSLHEHTALDAGCQSATPSCPHFSMATVRQTASCMHGAYSSSPSSNSGCRALRRHRAACRRCRPAPHKKPCHRLPSTPKDPEQLEPPPIRQASPVDAPNASLKPSLKRSGDLRHFSWLKCVNRGREPPCTAALDAQDHPKRCGPQQHVTAPAAAAPKPHDTAAQQHH